MRHFCRTSAAHSLVIVRIPAPGLVIVRIPAPALVIVRIPAPGLVIVRIPAPGRSKEPPIPFPNSPPATRTISPAELTTSMGTPWFHSGHGPGIRSCRLRCLVAHRYVGPLVLHPTRLLPTALPTQFPPTTLLPTAPPTRFPPTTLLPTAPPTWLRSSLPFRIYHVKQLKCALGAPSWERRGHISLSKTRQTPHLPHPPQRGLEQPTTFT